MAAIEVAQNSFSKSFSFEIRLLDQAKKKLRVRVLLRGGVGSVEFHSHQTVDQFEGNMPAPYRCRASASAP